MLFDLGHFKKSRRTVKRAILNVGQKIDKKDIRNKGFKPLFTLPQQHVIFAIVSQQCYNEPWQRLETVADFKYRPDVSDITVAVFVNEERKQMIYGIKGTSNFDDLLQDLSLGAGKIPEREYKQMLEQFNNTRKIFPGYNVMLTGHSLGGNKCLYISSVLSIPGVVFNSYIPRLDPIGIKLISSSVGVVKYTVNGDILSNNIQDLKGNFNVHVISVKALGVYNKHRMAAFF